mmetsp:Transcript_23500/g.45109  ORF Transcript_23500/g.45109 Transcript_23500/m.45109 type:complete len:85 (-) Transcript_23500:1330-1584(-)
MHQETKKASRQQKRNFSHQSAKDPVSRSHTSFGECLVFKLQISSGPGDAVDLAIVDVVSSTTPSDGALAQRKHNENGSQERMAE